MHAFLGFLTVYCSSCHTMVELGRMERSGFKDVLEAFLPEVVGFAFMVGSFVLLGTLWPGIAFWFLAHTLKAYYVYRGPIVNAEPENAS